MGQKVTPIGFRLGITYKPQSQWFVDPRSGSMKKIYPPLILEDRFIRDFITQKFPRTAIAQILIYRTLDYVKIEIHTAQAKKLSYQSVNKSSTELVSPSEKTKSSDNNSSSPTQENNLQTKHQSLSSGSEKNNTSSLSSVGHSNLKNLQQDLQVALLKYKKTLQIFSSWKDYSFYKNNHGSSFDRNREKTSLLEDETQELPKLWSYEANNFAISRKNNNNIQKEFQPFVEDESSTNGVPVLSDKTERPKQENSTSLTESDLSQSNNMSISSNSSSIETNSINEHENNYDTESNLLSQKEKVGQHIGIVVKQLNQPFQYASIFAKYLVSQLERRENSVKQALNRSLKLIQNYNIQGIKIKVSGRLNGVDMAETESILKGRIPLSTISANIDYYQDIAQTLYGTLGVKVFIYR